ncbi:MRNA splicing factor [Phytophthora palmivora]|uniref:mRNA splicing factor n=1 Tax=Phytophthora palmivora TaxID=4796 RepID=A0A2P4XT40_9STRA|nr:MRNA splicing factor [Phytophthora palmivora]
MADNAIPRAKRLKLLREAKARKERGDNSNGEAGELVAAALQPAADAPMVQTDANGADQAISDKSEDLVEKIAQVQEEDQKTDESDDELLNLAPKRANWDMERDIAPMLRKLERRTQHAIVEILREKLAAEQQEEDSDDEEEEEDEEETE